MLKRKLILTLLILSFCFGANAQNLQQEQREMRRKNNNPYVPPVEKTKVSQVFKLRGYTDSTKLIFSAMASCKMTCLSIDEKDVRTVLKEGLVNVSRSDVASAEKTFAVEYDSGKKLRVVVTPIGYSLLVVTVNTIDKKVECDCKN
jgi:hypothetical protein